MRINPQDASDGARLPAIRTATVTQQPTQPVKVVLSGEVRALVTMLANGLPDVDGIPIQDLLTHEDRLVLAWALELADDAGIDREEVRKLALELGQYRARQLGGPVSKPHAPSVVPGGQALLALPTLGEQDEQLAREIMISLATRSSRLDAAFVRALVDPDRRAAQPVSVALLHRLVAGPPFLIEGRHEPNAAVARFEARVVLAHTLRALALPVAGLRLEAPQLRDGATLLRARLPVVTGAGPWQLLAQLTRNDRSLLSMLYAGQQARGGDLRAVDQVASALIAMRAAERLLAHGAPLASMATPLRGPGEEPRAVPSTRGDPRRDTSARERGHAGEAGTDAREPGRSKASGGESVRGAQAPEEQAVDEAGTRAVRTRESSASSPRASVRAPDTREPRAREAEGREPRMHEPRVHAPEEREPRVREAEGREPRTREQDVREPQGRESRMREPDGREPRIREAEGREPRTREADTREAEAREPRMREPDAREPRTREPRMREPEGREPRVREADAHGSRASVRAPGAREAVVAREAPQHDPYYAARDSVVGARGTPPQAPPTNEPPGHTWHAGTSEPPWPGSRGGPLRSDPEPQARLPSAEERAWLLRTAAEQGRLPRATKPVASEGERAEPRSASARTPSAVAERGHRVLDTRVNHDGDRETVSLVPTHLAAKVAAAYRSVAPPRMTSNPPPGVDGGPDPVRKVSVPSALNVAQALGLGVLVERAHVQGLRTRRPFARELDPERRRGREAPDPERQRARAERRNWQWRRLLQRRARARRGER
ncbi:MAG TPA: hypothetical protein VI299_17335 [Polyangiales bacterium]